MPFFDKNPLADLARQSAQADAQLDLRGLAQADALERLDALLASDAHAATWFIQFDPPADDGQETLFLPIGRRLLVARRSGQLSSCLPTSDGAGYVIAFGN